MVKAATAETDNNRERPFLAGLPEARLHPGGQGRQLTPRARWSTPATTLPSRSLPRHSGTRSRSPFFMKQSSELEEPAGSRKLDGFGRATATARWLAGLRSGTLAAEAEQRAGVLDQLGFEEGNTWQYSFMIPFDYPALFAGMGGERHGDSAAGPLLPQAALLGRALLQHRERAGLCCALRLRLRRVSRGRPRKS